MRGEHGPSRVFSITAAHLYNPKTVWVMKCTHVREYLLQIDQAPLPTPLLHFQKTRAAWIGVVGRPKFSSVVWTGALVVML